jgi:hypothetical protein
VIDGGFEQNGKVYPHTSPHLKGLMPTGGDVGFKDGHVEWHKFNDTVNPFINRADSSSVPFWW